MAQVASVRPYPSHSGTPVCPSQACRTAGGSGAAPTMGSCSDAISASTGIRVNESYTEGTADIAVTP